MNKIIEKDMFKLLNDDINLEDFRNSTFLITGANGLIAKYYTYYLATLNQYKNLNVKIICLVRDVQKSQKNFEYFVREPWFKLLNQDVCDPINLNEKIDYIIHAAGAASAYHIVHDPIGIITANTIGTINVLEMAKTQDIKNIIFLSTREIYGKVPEHVTSIKESDMGITDPLDLRSCYPESKRMAESIFTAYYNQYNVPYTIARIAHTFGPTMEINNDGRIMADLIYFVVNDKDIVLNSDGSAIRCFCYISDTIRGLTRILLEGQIGEAYNLANETEPLTILEVAKTLIELFPEKKLNIITNQENALKSTGYLKIPRISLCTNKLEQLGWQPSIKLVEGLEKTVNYFEIEKTKKFKL